MPTTKTKKGFTLIEILVVISIIALLAGITIRAVGPARVKGRDAQRVSDLANIRIALALYKSRFGSYPVIDTACHANRWALSGNGKTTCWNGSGDGRLRGELEKVMGTGYTLPIDPKNISGGAPWGNTNTDYGQFQYAYIGKADGTKYDLIAQLEDKTSPYRCEIKKYKWHTNSDANWCNPGGLSYYLYADH